MRIRRSRGTLTSQRASSWCCRPYYDLFRLVSRSGCRCDADPLASFLVPASDAIYRICTSGDAVSLFLVNPLPTTGRFRIRHADLLHFIAQKERKCLELRDQLAAHEKELAERESSSKRHSRSRCNISPMHSSSSQTHMGTHRQPRLRPPHKHIPRRCCPRRTQGKRSYDCRRLWRAHPRTRVQRQGLPRPRSARNH